MSKTPYMPLWVSDFLGDTLDLDSAEVGAYMLLIMAQWNRNGGSLPNDQEKLKRVARCGRNWPKVWGNIERYFRTDDAGVYSLRCRLESQNVAAKRQVNAQNGAHGGRAKALKSKGECVATAFFSPERKATIPEPEPYKEDTKVSSSAKRGNRLSQDWFLPKEWGEWAIGEGWPAEVIRTESDKFKDYWHSVAGAKGIKLDWFATWRNWMRNNPKTQNLKAINGGSNGRPASKSQQHMDAFIAGARS